MDVLKPTLKRYSVTIDPTTMTEYKFNCQKEYLLIDIEAPEVSQVHVAGITRANCTNYEKMVRKYFAGEFFYDIRELHSPEPRTIKFLDTIKGVFTGNEYLLTLIVLEF
jgi:hypothetical protein